MTTTDPMTSTLAVRLEAFQHAASQLANEWEQHDSDAITAYPEWMPSFDEAVLDILAMGIK